MSSNAVADDVPVVRMEKIVKRFGTITALNNVDFVVNRQEVVGLHRRQRRGQIHPDQSTDRCASTDLWQDLH